MQHKLIFTLVAMLVFNAYSADPDTAHWPVVHRHILNTTLKMYDPRNSRVSATLWISAYANMVEQVNFSQQLLAYLDSTDSIEKAFGEALESNRHVVHAQLDLRIDGCEKLRAWGWIKDGTIFTKVDGK